MDAKDFLQDPDMWVDKLPQPYRLTADILNDFLEHVWGRIRENELLKQRAAARGRVPHNSKSVLLCEEELTHVCAGLACASGGRVVVGNGMSVCMLRCGAGGEETKDSVSTPVDECARVEVEEKVSLAKVVEQMNINSPIIKLAVIENGHLLVVIMQLATGISLYSFCISRNLS